MRELFRLRIAAKRQMTAPQRLMDALSLSEGDEFQIEVSEGRIVAVHPCKAVPMSLLSSDLLAEIRKQEHRLAQGKGLSVEQAISKPEEPEQQPRSKPAATVRMHRSAAGKRRKVKFETGITS